MRLAIGVHLQLSIILAKWSPLQDSSFRNITCNGINSLQNVSLNIHGRPYSNWGGLCPASHRRGSGSRPRQSMWDLRAKWFWDTSFSRSIGLPLSISLHRRYIFTHISGARQKARHRPSSMEIKFHPNPITRADCTFRFRNVQNKAPHMWLYNYICKHSGDFLDI